MHYVIPFDKTIQNVVTLLQAHTSSGVNTEKEKKLWHGREQPKLQGRFYAAMMKLLHKGPSLMISVELILTVPRCSVVWQMFY
ncbi:hypothetical protein FHG87_005772 [Trinorchestia longiramus]|nr:hypothetical protein FHG87_005772 [Trinorchestia longiramus]